LEASGAIVRRVALWRIDPLATTLPAWSLGLGVLIQVNAESAGLSKAGRRL
jgi:hypothetical protein